MNVQLTVAEPVIAKPGVVLINRDTKDIARELVRLHTETSWPAATRFPAIAAPMIPVPITATFIAAFACRGTRLRSSGMTFERLTEDANSRATAACRGSIGGGPRQGSAERGAIPLPCASLPPIGMLRGNEEAP